MTAPGAHGAGAGIRGLAAASAGAAPWRAGAAAAGAGCLLGAWAASDPDLAAALMSVAVALAAAWLLAEGLCLRRGASATALLGTGVGFLVAIPALLVAADPGLIDLPGTSLQASLALYAVGLFSIVAGVRLGSALPVRREPPLGGAVAVPPLSLRRKLLLAAVPAGAFVAFLASVGGPAFYFRNLDSTGALTAGKTYLIWGVLAGKYLVLARIGLRWQAGEGATRAQKALLVLSLLAVGAVGARLLVMIAVLQAGFLWLVLRPPSALAWKRLLPAALVLLVVFVGLGELRRWQSLNTGTSFPAYLAETGIERFPATFVNQYADAIRLGMIVRSVVPEQAGYEYGKDLVRVVLQPIPGGIRPELSRAPALQAAFFGYADTGNALPLPVVGLIQLGLAGIVVLCGLLGLMSSLIDRLLHPRLRLDVLLALVGAATGTVILFRGSLPNAVAFTLMDVIGFFAAARAVGARRSASRG